MTEIHVLINSDGVPIAALSDKSLIEEYVTCPCEDECESCESHAAPGKKWSYGELDFDTVGLNDPSFIRQPVDSRENSKTNQVHVLSNGFGEILEASTNKAFLEESVAYPPEDKCQYCESYESRGETCPYRQSFIDTVDLDNPNLVQRPRSRIAYMRLQDGRRPASTEQAPPPKNPLRKVSCVRIMWCQLVQLSDREKLGTEENKHGNGKVRTRDRACYFQER